MIRIWRGTHLLDRHAGSLLCDDYHSLLCHGLASRAVGSRRASFRLATIDGAGELVVVVTRAVRCEVLRDFTRSVHGPSHPRTPKKLNPNSARCPGPRPAPTPLLPQQLAQPHPDPTTTDPAVAAAAGGKVAVVKAAEAEAAGAKASGGEAAGAEAAGSLTPRFVPTCCFCGDRLWCRACGTFAMALNEFQQQNPTPAAVAVVPGVHSITWQYLLWGLQVWHFLLWHIMMFHDTLNNDDCIRDPIGIAAALSLGQYASKQWPQ